MARLPGEEAQRLAKEEGKQLARDEEEKLTRNEVEREEAERMAKIKDWSDLLQKLQTNR